MEIWIHRNGQFAGRFSESDIRAKIADGSFSSADLAWNETKSSWQPISEFLAAVPAAASTSSPANSIPATPEKEKPAAIESKAADTPRPTPPPLPSTPSVSAPVRSAGPPPLPAAAFATPAAAAIHPAPGEHPPEGENIWSPYVAILGSIFLTPAFGGFFIWRNWLKMNRRRRAMVAAPWFWLGFGVVGLLFYSRDRIVWVIWLAYLLAWLAFSAYPQIRYVHTTFKRERMRSGLPLLAAFVLGVAGFATYWLTAPATKTIATLEPGPQPQPTPAQVSKSQSDRMFSADELRDMYKSSVLEVRTTWKEKKGMLKKDNGASGTGVLLYNDSE